MKKTLEKIIDYAVKISDPERIILFGSMAHGNMNSMSDVDLLIISAQDLMKKEIVSMIKSYTEELSLQTDVLVYSQSEINLEMKKNNSFVTAIVKYGKIAFESEKYLHVC